MNLSKNYFHRTKRDKSGEILDEENWQVLYHLLNKNRSVKYFPKTRKTDEYGEVFGFLKIVPKK